MDKENMKNIIKAWITRIEETTPVPNDIVALNFGLYEPYSIDLTGAAWYDIDDDNWACDEDYVPDERDCPDLGIDNDEDWEDVLEMILSILKDLVFQMGYSSLLSVEHITTGFCDGDLFIVK